MFFKTFLKSNNLKKTEEKSIKILYLKKLSNMSKISSVNLSQAYFSKAAHAVIFRAKTVVFLSFHKILFSIEGNFA